MDSPWVQGAKQPATKRPFADTGCRHKRALVTGGFEVVPWWRPTPAYATVLSRFETVQDRQQPAKTRRSASIGDSSTMGSPGHQQRCILEIGDALAGATEQTGIHSRPVTSDDA